MPFPFFLSVRQLCLLALALYFLVGCSARTKVITVTTPEERANLVRLMILPFRDMSTEAFPIKKMPFPGQRPPAVFEKSEPDAHKIVEEIFREQISKHKHYLVDDSMSGQVYKKLLSADIYKDDLSQLFKSLGREANVDGIIIGYVYRYRERQGRAYAVRRPASVAFEINLIQTTDGAVIWKGYYDKTQKSLVENLLDISFFLRQRGRWATARELTEEGIKELIERLSSTN